MSVKQAESKITALYERLSRDDDNAGDSNSMQHKSNGRAHGRKPCEKLRTRKKRKQHKIDADGGLPQIGQAAVFAQKWRYHAYF